MAKNSRKSIQDIFKRINDTLIDAIDKKNIRPMAEFTIALIVKRTRLGYGVSKQFGSKEKLKPLSNKYIDFRKKLLAGKKAEAKARKKGLKFNGASQTIKLSNLTTAARSNLTLTGQMLDSMQILKESKGKIVIGPLGQRSDGKASNEEIADYQGKQGRVFNRVSLLEFNQIIREYRRTFGDLLNKRRLLR